VSWSPGSTPILQGHLPEFIPPEGGLFQHIFKEKPKRNSPPTLAYPPFWFGLFAPKGTPKDIINRLNAAVVDALADIGTRSRLVDFGEDVVSDDQQNPEALHLLQQATIKKWWPLITEFAIKAE
jgi:Tripartite tricarboxylate transporter family receptor